MEDFKNYLLGIKIDSDRFRQALPEQWDAFRKEFEAGGEKPFFLRKRFLLNPLRLEFPFATDK